MVTNEVHRLLDEARPRALDIHEHIATLLALSGSCSQIVEFGVNTGTSTLAFLAGGCDKLDSWDITRTPSVEQIERAAGDRWTFHLESSLVADIPQCDLLFIDSFHTAEQLDGELKRHHHRVRDRILMHDTEGNGHVGEAGHAGLRVALIDFLMEHCEEWRIESHWKFNHGLTLLRRIG